VVRGGSVSIWSKERVEAVFPDLDLKRASMTLLDLPDYADIEQLFSESLAAPPREVEEALINRANSTGATAAIVVQCSCGHTFVLDT
jgi:hypothetical protein